MTLRGSFVSSLEIESERKIRALRAFAPSRIYVITSLTLSLSRVLDDDVCLCVQNERMKKQHKTDCSLETRSRRTRGDEPGETAREASRGEKCHGEQTHLDGSTQSVAKQKRTLEFDEGEIDESGGYFGGEGRADCVFEE